jgi:hypothetical protein
MNKPPKQPEREPQQPNPDDVLRRMLRSPPEPHKPPQPQKKEKPAK